MVQLDKLQGQKGHMVLHEDGTIVSSSGDLASSEVTAQQLLQLVQHSLSVNFAEGQGQGEGHRNRHRELSGDNTTNPTSTSSSSHPSNGTVATTTVGGAHLVNGDSSTMSNGGQQQHQVWKWSRITVDFGDHSYTACLSNRKIHLLKREHLGTPTTGADGGGDNHLNHA